MPALVYVEYENDGVSCYQCSACKAGFSLRGSPNEWKVCPYCTADLSHTEETNSGKAREKRRDRSEYRRWIEYGTEYLTLYWVRAWIPNDNKSRGWFNILRKRPTIEDYYFEGSYATGPKPPKLKTGDDAFFAWGDYACLNEEGPGDKMPEPFVSYKAPDQGEGWKRVSMTRKGLVEFIHKYHGYPMEFGLLKGDDK